jgi:UDP-N-acetylmuramyl pentapeptide phosphotransferase/UDP-N-acetylglucosamine-1-phosphate transferase
LAVVAAFAIAWSRRRRAVVVLSIVYVAAWIGLLAWNAERAHHFLGKGM